MENKAYRQFVAAIWPVLSLAIILLIGCSPVELPPTAAPSATALAAGPVAPTEATLVAATPGISPSIMPAPSQTAATAPSEPTATSTPIGAPSPDASAREGDTLPPPSLSPTPPATFIVPCVAGSDALEVRSGPDPGYDLITTLPAGTALAALKYTADEVWLLVETPQHDIGWVAASAVSCQGDLSLLPIAEGVSGPAPAASPPAATPTPTPTPLPAASSASPTLPAAAPTPAGTDTPTPAASPTLPAPTLANWRGEYYNNADLGGDPVLVRDDPTLEFNWGPDSPAPGVPPDNFSARWTRQFEFAEGDYRFFADVDDGVKLYLDGWLIIDEWNTNPYVLHSGVFADVKAGLHTLMVEYFEAQGDAHLKVWFEKTIISENKWVGEYYNNPDFQGAPVLVREDDDIDFNWDDDEPASGMPDNDFSIRWQRTVMFEEGNYDFEAEVAEEDRVRIYLDNFLILEEHEEDGGLVTGSFNNVGGGYHTIKVEYIDYSGDASIEVDWERDD